MLLAINFLDRLLGQVGHHAGNVLTNGFLLHFPLLVLTVLAVSATVLVILSVTTVLRLSALTALVLAAKSLAATIASVEGILHRTASKATGTSRKGTATVIAITAVSTTVVVTTSAIAVVAVVRKTAKSTCIALLVTRTIAVTTATGLGLLLGLLDTGENRFVGLEHLGLHRRLLEFHAGRNHCGLCRGRCSRSGRLRSRSSGSGRSSGLHLGLGSRCSRSCRSGRLRSFNRCRLFCNGCRSGRSSCRSSGLRSFNRSRLYRSGCRGGRSSCRSGRLCRSSGGGSSSGLCSRSCGFRRLFALDKLDLQLAFASRSGLFLLIRSIGSFGGRRLFQVLVAGFGLLAFAFGGRFDLLVVRGIHLGHVSTDSHARVAKQLHHDIDLDAVGFSPIYWFNLIFISHE